MKKYSCIIGFMLMVCLFAACSRSAITKTDNIIDLTSSEITPDNESLTISVTDDVMFTEPFIPTYPRDLTLEFWSDYSVEYCEEFYTIDTRLARSIGIDEFENWLREFNALNDLPMDGEYRDRNELNIVTFVREFEISKDNFISIMSSANFYTEKMVDALYSDDINIINEAFANSYAMYYDGKMYTMKWFNQHEASDYAKERLLTKDITSYFSRVKSNFSNNPNVNFEQLEQKAVAYEQAVQSESLKP